MAIVNFAPNTIYLGGGEGPGGQDGYTPVNDVAASGEITPGMLVEYYNDSGTLTWKVHSSADTDVQRAFALNAPYLNRGIDDAYADGDNVLDGAVVYAIIPSGQDISPADKLQSNGDGKLKALASGVAVCRALESSGGAVTEDTRLRVEVM
jgi:hypothetical protein